ncbi:hypothetical protein BFS35_011050 [Macrococcoides goetzii]|uniref:Uncharacterized protein n=1 Tax=Macrococcoides goetzii TaxID=1891097 RepID=A0A2G5NW47_9STAP|nr:hypothetical protein [Macrococcus goetzii]RAI79676.1 hypothetical protein BFS35_011050 [Macrococcus goetzii]
MIEEHTPHNILKDVIENIKDIEDIVVVVRYDNEQITQSYSHMKTTEVVGLLECAKHSVLLDMTEEFEED